MDTTNSVETGWNQKEKQTTRPKERKRQGRPTNHALNERHDRDIACARTSSGAVRNRTVITLIGTSLLKRNTTRVTTHTHIHLYALKVKCVSALRNE